MARQQARQRRRNLIKTVAVSILSPLLLAGAVFMVLYSFTDTIMAPPQMLSSSPLPDEWTMFRRDLTRTGAINPGAPPPQGKLKWSFATGAAIHSSPTVVDGVVYFGSRDFHLYAVDAETGREKWRFKAGSWVESSPTVVDGIVYFGSNDGFFYALDARTGHEMWRFRTRFPVKSSPAVADGRVYFGSDNYSLYCLDARTGTKLWEYETGGFVLSSPAVANGIVYFGSMDNHLYALQADNGRFRLRFRAYEIAGSPAVKDGKVYFTSRYNLYVLDGRARNWPGEGDLRGWWIQFYAFRLAPSPPPVSGYLWSKLLGSQSFSTPVVTDDAIYTSFNNRLYAVDPDTAEVKWMFFAGGEIASSPALGSGILYVGSQDGNLYAISTTDGKALWHFATGGEITASPALVNGVVYITSHDGRLYAIE